MKRKVIVITVGILLFYLVFIKLALFELSVGFHLKSEAHYGLEYTEIVIGEFGTETRYVEIYNDEELVETLLVLCCPLPFIGKYIPGLIICDVCGLPG